MEEETGKGLWDPELMARFMDIVRSRPELFIKPEEVETDRSARIFEEIVGSGALEWCRTLSGKKSTSGSGGTGAGNA